MRTQSFDFKIEEFVPFCRFVLISYEGDRPAFIIFSPDYDGNHLSSCKTSLEVIDKIINPKGLTAQMKKATETLHARLDDALTFIGDLERYCEKAGKNLPLTKKDLGFSKTRTSCHSKDAEGAAAGLKLMQQLVEPHLTILEAKGYTKVKQDKLSSLIKDIEDANTLQNKLLNDRGKLVQDNMVQIEEFWDVINDILKSGKNIFRKDKVKIKEYTQTAILSRIRHKPGPDDDAPKA